MAVRTNPFTIDSYALTLPSQWSEVPLEADERSTFIADAKAELAKADGWTKTHERRFDLSLTQYDHALQAMNASFAATYVDVWPADEVTAELGADDSGEPLLVTASCAMGTISRKGVGEDLPLTAPTLLMAVANERSKVPVDPRVLGATDLEPPAIVELDAGRAVRVRRHQFVRTSLGKADGVFTETYLVPHSEDGDHACILSFGTTSVKLTTDFAALFARIAETLRFFTPDQSTVSES